MREATEKELNLLELPTVESLLPIIFHDTDYTVRTLEFTCGNCSTRLPLSAVRGHASRLIERVVDLELLGVCPACNVATPFRIRIQSDRTCNWLDSDGSWQQFTVYASNGQRLKHALKDMVGAIKKRLTGT